MSFWFPHKVTVKDLIGRGGKGLQYDEPRQLDSETIDEIRLVRGADGAEVVSSSRVTVAISANVPVGSLVTVWPGGPGEREATVIAVSREENGAPLPSQLVLSLT